ncbi:hypothetical protein [Aurantiacibacter flavus]|uniref:Uncharacterized protein n=1 Tax=Aurantiacibacter flavus TaxID=3145232 RepID=A0ABV0D0I2_9SPHN
MTKRWLAIAPLALAVAGPAMAQNVPDLEGFWGLSWTPGEPAADMVEALPPNTVMIDDTGAAEFPRGEFGGLILTPEAMAHAETWRSEDDMTLDRVCLPPSIVYAIQGPFPFEVHQTPELIVFKYEYFDQTRLIFMDGRSAPEGQPPSKMGFSVGHWEGDELVIETDHIAASTITNNGLDHSDDITMVERYRLSEDGSTLMATQWFSDPASIENNGARWIEWEKREGEHIYPYECDPTFALEYGAVEE